MKLELVKRPWPMGSITLAFGEGILCAVEFDDPRKNPSKDWLRRFRSIELVAGTGVREVVERIDAYFAGDVHAIDSIPVEPGGTPFQQSVWRELRNIPAGRTASYGDIARAIRNPKAVRAVGQANGANPIPIVIPCHRVVATGGGLGGYGGGLDRKSWLLRHESAMPLKAKRAAQRTRSSGLFVRSS